MELICLVFYFKVLKKKHTFIQYIYGMKKALYLLITVCLLFINCKSVKHINGFGEEDNVCRKYDVVNDITYVSNFSNDTPILVKGKWRKNEPNTPIQISHCPGVENEFSTVLELMIWEYDKEEWLGKSNESILMESFNKQAAFWDKITVKYEFIKSDKRASYAIYKVFEFEERRIELMGVKNKKYYRIAIYNFDPNQYIAIEDFLIGIFTIN